MQEISDLQKEKMGDHQELQKWSAKPEKLRRQTDILTNSLKGLRAQDESMTTKVRADDRASGGLYSWQSAFV